MKPICFLRVVAVLSAAVVVAAVHVSAAECDKPAGIEFKRDDAQGQMQVLVGGKEVFVYRYGDTVDLPHYFPVRSPSGKPLTVQQTEPYPHHRSVWFADFVQLEGHRKVNFYMSLYTRTDPKDPHSPFRDRIRQVEFLPARVSGNQAEMAMRLLWEMEYDVPILDELREMRVVDLGGGEYFLDLTFTVTASYGDVAFLSDAAHYAWPYIRMSPEFSVQKGGRMTSSEGGINQAGTHGKPATWIDYSNTVDGVTEGLAVFSHRENGHPHTWLTRDYGTFGPRRADPQNGKPFTVKKGESLKQRIGILVHRGDADGGKVAERYQQYVDGTL
jgi:hypothetical protein